MREQNRRISNLSVKNARLNFSERCYQLLREVPAGRVTTYALIAKALGSKGYRAVGNSMHRNPHAPEVPCHRVVRSDGAIGGFAQGPKKKIAMLSREGITVRNGKVENLEQVLYLFN